MYKFLGFSDWVLTGSATALLTKPDKVSITGKSHFLIPDVCVCEIVRYACVLVSSRADTCLVLILLCQSSSHF